MIFAWTVFARPDRNEGRPETQSARDDTRAPETARDTHRDNSCAVAHRAEVFVARADRTGRHPTRWSLRGGEGVKKGYEDDTVRDTRTTNARSGLI